MPIAALRDICLDATDALMLGRFWSAALGASFHDNGDKSARIDHVRPGDLSVWVDPVPEPRTGKTRVHLDLRLPTADPAPLVAAGATVVRVPDAEISWWVLADPDGNQFRAFPPRPGAAPAAVEVYELVVDAADPSAQATWWASVTGGRVDAGSVLGAAGFPAERWVFDAVSEPKTVKNRMHWDVDLTAADPGELVAAGARVLREPDDVISWWIMADPEGNEFCAFAPDAS
ncbi:VOC family protein [Asanoa sp. NPDC049518]|uniref:VOC family protein n=1 Tax=unclassified Asanoa TaxID=2685164 RepID=UPI003412A146